MPRFAVTVALACLLLNGTIEMPIPTFRFTALTTLGFALCLCAPEQARAQDQTTSPAAAAAEPSAAAQPCSDCNEQPAAPPPPVADAAPVEPADSNQTQPAIDGPPPA